MARLVRLDVDLPNAYFEIKDDFLYYLENGSVIQLNLKTRQETEFRFADAPECDFSGLKLLDDDIYLYHYIVGEKKHILSKLEFNSESESVVSTTSHEIEKFHSASFTQTSHYCFREFNRWDESHYRSRFVTANKDFSQLFCSENRRLYTSSGLSPNSPVFTCKNRLYYIRREANKLLLKSFALEDKTLSMRTEELIGQVGLCNFDVYSCVFGEDIYFVEYGSAPKMFKLELSSLTVMDVTSAIGDFNIGRVNQDNKSIYVTDYDETSKKVKSFYKLAVTENKSDPLKCPRCEAPFEIPKIIKGCGHSICDSCEENMLKPFVDADNRKLNCPIAECKNVAVLSKGEKLPTNHALKEIVEKGGFTPGVSNQGLPSISSTTENLEIGINEPSLMKCFSCPENVQLSKAMKCFECIAKLSVPANHVLCGHCAAKKHKGHNYDDAFVDDATKRSFLAKFASANDNQVKRKAFELIAKAAANLKRKQESDEALGAKIRRMNESNVPTDQWQNECAEMEQLFKKALQEKLDLADQNAIIQKAVRSP